MTETAFHTLALRVDPQAACECGHPVYRHYAARRDWKTSRLSLHCYGTLMIGPKKRRGCSCSALGLDAAAMAAIDEVICRERAEEIAAKMTAD